MRTVVAITKASFYCYDSDGTKMASAFEFENNYFSAFSILKRTVISALKSALRTQ
ncbi:hypothetical protein [Patiriisocius sp. Uisw_017]|jgi:hypothetical protein|uniref:hypothetical protein n=1 Tax=Patiriisocius sp. Uisw_017 TaxID=3230968 RepID=UPI0039EBB3E6